MKGSLASASARTVSRQVTSSPENKTRKQAINSHYCNSKGINRSNMTHPMPSDASIISVYHACVSCMFVSLSLYLTYFMFI